MFFVFKLVNHYKCHKIYHWYTDITNGGGSLLLSYIPYCRGINMPVAAFICNLCLNYKITIKERSEIYRWHTDITNGGGG